MILPYFLTNTLTLPSLPCPRQNWISKALLFSLHIPYTSPIMIRNAFFTLFALAILAASITAALLWPLQVIAVTLVFISILYWTKKP